MIPETRKLVVDLDLAGHPEDLDSFQERLTDFLREGASALHPDVIITSAMVVDEGPVEV